MFEYPRLSNWISYQKTSEEEYLVRDHLMDEEYSVDTSVMEFAIKLDGKRDPYDIDPSRSKREVRHILMFLRDYDLIRTSHFLLDSADSFAYTLWIPQWKTISKTAAITVSILLFVLWLPVLILGISLFFRNYIVIDTNVYLSGSLAGTLCGLILHELAHGFTAAACGVPVFEFGIMIRWFILPGAYTLMDHEHCSRLKRIQIIAAGVEMNFLIAGLCLIFSSLAHNGNIWFSIALTNILLALINLAFSDGLDGIRIFIDLLGGDPDSFLEEAKSVIKSSAERRALRKKGIAGHSIIALAYLVIFVQIFIPSLLIINVLGVLGWLN